MKSYILIGLSSFGKYLARFLADRGFNVTVIDTREELVEEIKPHISCGIIGNAKDKETLKKIGVEEADGVVVSLGEKVDDSLLVIYHLKELNVKELYVKVLTEEHAQIVNLIEASEIIFPERESAYKLAQRIDNPNVLDYIPLHEGYSIIDWAPPEDFFGKTLRDLDLKRNYNVQVISIEETVPDRIKLVPKANHVIKDSDVLVVMGTNEDLERLKALKKS